VIGIEPVADSPRIPAAARPARRRESGCRPLPNENPPFVAMIISPRRLPIALASAARFRRWPVHVTVSRWVYAQLEHALIVAMLSASFTRGGHAGNRPATQGDLRNLHTSVAKRSI